ncbi:MAG: alpha/beta fold hydrolase [Candidatus Dormibacteria bacterium]
MSDPGDPQERLEDAIDRYEREMKLRPAVTGSDASTAPEVDLVASATGPRLKDLDPTLLEVVIPGAGEATPLPVEDLDTWWSRGERIQLELPARHGRPAARWQVFARVEGVGPWLTLLHGFPTSSWDWAPLVPLLAGSHRLLMIDLLGFGNSDKPGGHDWSTFEQADLVEAAWRHYGITGTRMVAHDVGMTVALELLARQQDGAIEATISDLTLLNGGVYTGFHRPRPIQVLLQKPILGAVVARLMSEPKFASSFAEIFSQGHQPSASELHQQWQSIARRNGNRTFHRLIRYIPERRRFATRWESAVEKTAIPTRFVWGMADPVSGAHMAAAIRERQPGVDLVELHDLGHYPQLEDPGRVVEEILRPFPGGSR